jgi:signal transduction histidine kinase
MVGERIVIVEDEKIVAWTLQSRLEAFRYVVVGVAESGKEALVLIEQTKPDLVLMDVGLSGNQNGIEVAQAIRERWNLPIVFLTGHADMETLQSVQNVEPYGYLLKPFESAELYCAIEIALNRYQSQQELEQLVQKRTEELAAMNERLSVEITERRRAEAETLQALEKERELSDLKSRFITTASHEFRTPLSIVLTSAELLERLGNNCSEERRSRYLQKIRNAVRSMTTILTDMLTLGKADSGTLQFQPTPFDLQRFCSSLLSDLELGLESRPRVKFHYSADRIEAQLDPELLSLILNHLLSNAIKYSPDGSDVFLRVTFLCVNDRTFATFEVQDHGIGIPPEDLPRIFEPFHRSKNVDTIPGTGLGLTIVQECTELHGGTVHVESEFGRGTLVTVRLPIEESSD